jgi:hypothetical protein
MSFALGQIVATPGAMKYDAEQLSICLMRHARGDWGDLDAEDIAANDSALQYGSRLFSSYDMPDGKKLWIITEWDRSVTTFLLPSEY